MSEAEFEELSRSIEIILKQKVITGFLVAPIEIGTTSEGIRLATLLPYLKKVIVKQPAQGREEEE